MQYNASLSTSHFFPYLHPGLVRVCSLVLFLELYFKGFYKSSENAEDKDMGCTGQMGKLQRVDVTVLWSPNDVNRPKLEKLHSSQY